MAAPIGNQFWKLRSKHGRDKLFATPELMWDAACEYFEWCDNNPFYEVEQKRGNINVKLERGASADGISDIIDEIRDNTVDLPKMRPYTIQGLCLYLDCNVQYFKTFKAQLRKEDKDFNTILSRIEEIIYNQKFSGAASGFFDSRIIARDLGLSDKKELTGKDGERLIPSKIKWGDTEIDI